MNILILLLVAIWVLSFPSFSVPLDVKPDPPASDPVLPTEKDPFFKNSTDLVAHSPGTFLDLFFVIVFELCCWDLSCVWRILESFGWPFCWFYVFFLRYLTTRLDNLANIWNYCRLYELVVVYFGWHCGAFQERCSKANGGFIRIYFFQLFILSPFSFVHFYPLLDGWDFGIIWELEDGDEDFTICCLLFIFLYIFYISSFHGIRSCWSEASAPPGFKQENPYRTRCIIISSWVDIAAVILFLDLPTEEEMQFKRPPKFRFVFTFLVVDNSPRRFCISFLTVHSQMLQMASLLVPTWTSSLLWELAARRARLLLLSTSC